MLGVVFRKAQNRIQDPAKLRRLIVDLIDREHWMTLDVDVKGDAYEGLLAKNAEDLKIGRGPVLHAARADPRDRRGDAPRAGDAICDPACGTGGFLLAAYEWIVRNTSPLDPDQKRAPSLRGAPGLGDRREHGATVRHEPAAARDRRAEDDASPIVVDDALKADPGDNGSTWC